MPQSKRWYFFLAKDEKILATSFSENFLFFFRVTKNKNKMKMVFTFPLKTEKKKCNCKILVMFRCCSRPENIFHLTDQIWNQEDLNLRTLLTWPYQAAKKCTKTSEGTVDVRSRVDESKQLKNKSMIVKVMFRKVKLLG